MTAGPPQHEPPDPEDVFFERARFLFVARRYDDVLALVAAHWKADPECPTAYGWVSWVAMERGDFEGALAAAEKRASLTPGEGVVHHDLARVLARKGDGPRALAAALKARELEPDNAEYRATLSEALSTEGRAAEAEREARASLALDPGYVHAHVALLRALNGLGRYRDALAAAGTAPTAALALPWAHFHRGAALAGLGRRNEAAESFAAALRIMPGWETARYEGMRAKIERSRLYDVACTLQEQQSSVAMRLVFPASMGVVLWFFGLSVARMAGARGDAVLAATGAIGAWCAWCVRLVGADPEALFVLTRRRGDLARGLASEGERRGATALGFRFAALAVATAHAVVDGPAALVAHLAADFLLYEPASRAFADDRIGRRGFAAAMGVSAAAVTAVAAAFVRRGA